MRSYLEFRTLPGPVSVAVQPLGIDHGLPNNDPKIARLPDDCCVRPAWMRKLSSNRRSRGLPACKV